MHHIHRSPQRGSPAHYSCCCGLPEVTADVRSPRDGTGTSTTRGVFRCLVLPLAALVLLAFWGAFGLCEPVHAADPNRSPSAGGDSYSTAEDSLLVIGSPTGVLANDTDPDGEPLHALLVASAFYGDLDLSLDGSFVYTPAQDFAGLDLFQYQASDGISTTSPIWVWLNVTGVNDPPTAADYQFDSDEDSTLKIGAPGLLGGASDIEGDSLTALLVNAPAHGAVALALDGSFTYTPTQNFFGSDWFTYKANDGQLDSAAATVSLEVRGVNDPPVLKIDLYKITEDATLIVDAPGVLANDRDPEGDPLTARIVTPPAHGVAVLAPNGSLVYTPTQNFNGYETIAYVANDGQADSAKETIFVTVEAVNDSIPVALDDSYGTPEDTTLTVADPGILANDSDAEGDPLSRLLLSNPQHGVLASKKTGAFTYTPDANFSGIDTFTYQATDKLATSNTATVTITVHSVNDAPQGQPDAYEATQNAMLSVPAPGLLLNDLDIEGDGLSVSVVVWPQHGWLLYRPDGSFDYLPYSEYNGSDTFTYRLFDGTAWSGVVQVQLNVVRVNRAPAAAPDQYDAREDVSLSVPAPGALANDVDADGDPLSASLVGSPSHGDLVLNSDGSFVFSPSRDYSGSDAFTYKVSDGRLESSPVTVTINIAAENDAPVAANDTQFPATQEDQPLTVAAPGVLGNDADTENSPLAAALAKNPVHGTLTLQPGGAFTYTPAPNYYGGDSFTYRASDGVLTSNEASVSLTVTPVNDAPVAQPDSYSAREDEPLAVSAPGILANDTDADKQRVSAQLVAGPQHGKLTLNGDGSLRYEPNKDYFGGDTFTYRASDGQASSGAVTVAIQIAPVNDRPEASDDAYALQQDSTLTVRAPGILRNDSDVDNSSLAAILVAGPQHGALTLAANGGLRYVPVKAYHGGDSFTYRADDGSLRSPVATVLLSIGDAADPPVAANDKIKVVQGGKATVLSNGATSVLANDSAIDPGPMKAVLQAKPAHGQITLNADGTLAYQHDGSLTWSDSFTYVAQQNGVPSNAATVTVEVQPDLDFAFTHTAGIAGLHPPCSGGVLRIPSASVVQHCYTLRNIGHVPLDVHELVDSRLGTLLRRDIHTVVPGATYTHVVTETMTAGGVSTATWTATYRLPTAAASTTVTEAEVDGATLAEHAKSHSAQVTLIVSTASDDQDGDEIPDNVEGAGDVDDDDIANYLDPDSDGDGFPDNKEAGSDPSHPRDSNNDGIADYLDATVPGETARSPLFLPAIQSSGAPAAAAQARPQGTGEFVSLYLPAVIR